MKKTRKEMHKKNYFDPYGKLNFFLLFRINDYKVIFRNISFKILRIILNNKFHHNFVSMFFIEFVLFCFELKAIVSFKRNLLLAIAQSLSPFTCQTHP